MGCRTEYEMTMSRMQCFQNKRILVTQIQIMKALITFQTIKTNTCFSSRNSTSKPKNSNNRNAYDDYGYGLTKLKVIGPTEKIHINLIWAIKYENQNIELTTLNTH